MYVDPYADAPQSVRDFLNHKLVNQGKSKKTCYQYYHDLRTFFRFLLCDRDPIQYGNRADEDIPFSDVTDELIAGVQASDINKFLSYCAEGRGNKEAARNRKLSAIRSFYKYLTFQKPEMLEKNPTERLETVKKPKRLPKFLTLEESKSLLDNIDGANYERDFAIVTLFLNCGLRVSEMAGISLRDVSRDFETLRVIGKGNKERFVYLNDACKSALQAYLEVRPQDPRPEAKDALFISRNRNRISVQTIQWLIYKHLREAGLDRPGMSVHKLRHTAATLMYQYGHTDVRLLKEILGHEALSTTEIYTHISDKQLRQAMEDNPLSDIKPAQKPGTLPPRTSAGEEDKASDGENKDNEEE